MQIIFALIVFGTGYWYWLFNFELAFASSFMIILGSLYAYRSMIIRRIQTHEPSSDDEMLEKIEDPYALYDDETNNVEEDKALSQIIKEEKLRLKQNKQSFKKTMKSSRGMFSPWRLIPYVFLVLSFIGLRNNHILDIPAFLIGLAVGIVASVYVGRGWLSKGSAD